MSHTVEIVEVGARDGLQNENVVFSTADKLHLINGALAAGIKRIEVASFVHPKLVPQMADAEAVVAGLSDNKDVTYIGLILNKRGLVRSLNTRKNGERGIDEVGCVAVASNMFGEKNQGQDIRQSIMISKAMTKQAISEGLSAQITISAAFGCPFEGPVNPDLVIDIAKEIAEAHPREIAIADTIGVAGPGQVFDMVSRLKDELPGMPIRAHFHNTRGTGIANAYAAFTAGATVLDASVGGLGGCPFAPGATGNIATEDLVFMLQQSHVETNVKLAKLIEVTKWGETVLGRTMPSSVAKAKLWP